MVTTSQDVLDRFIQRSNNAARIFDEWKNNQQRANVVSVVLSHSTSVIDNVSQADVESIAKQTDHALGDSSSRIGNAVETIRDWNPEYAFTHIFHYITEKIGSVPTWQEFKDIAKRCDDVMGMIYLPSKEIIAKAVKEGWNSHDAKMALQWRLGNAYYSFLREIHVFSIIRRRNPQVSMHPLADALFRVDMWNKNTNINLYIGNARFRSMSKGRKLTSSKLLSDAYPPFKNIDLELEPRHSYGDVHLVHPDRVYEAISKMNWTENNE